MADLPPFLPEVQTSVLRSVNPQVVFYLFFEIVDLPAFRKWLPTTQTWDMMKGSALAAIVPDVQFISEEERISRPHNKNNAASAGGAEGGALPFSTGARGVERHKGTFEGIFGNIAFTFNGLRTLGVAKETLATFPEAFCEGMASRAAILGDVGETAPEHWDGYLGSSEVHGVAWFNWRNPAPIADSTRILAIYKALLGSLEKQFPLMFPQAGGDRQKRTNGSRDAQVLDGQGIRVLHFETGMANYASEGAGTPFRIEHFGFRDGVSQPYANLGLAPPPPGGGTPRANGSWAPVAVGEVLIGHRDEDGRVQHLPANRLLSHNGTYMTLRKLEQDVVGFRNFMKRAAKDEPLALAAQMVGRWPDGASLVKYPYGPEQSASGDPGVNDFRYQQDDPLGRRCPIGAHVRRANPRDTNDRDEARRHRLFRRSISYGGPLLPEGSTGDGKPRGLLFITMQARLDRQFEFVQASWLNSGEFEGQAGARIDPITGAHGGEIEDAFQPAGAFAPVIGLPSFVTMRGGDYFFIPSLPALKALAAGKTFPPDDPDAPIPQDSIGDIQPATTNDLDEIVAIGKALLTSTDSVYWLPVIRTYPYPGAPQPTVVKSAVVGRYGYVKSALKDDKHFSTRTLGDRALEITGGQKLLIGLRDADPERRKRLECLHSALKLLPSWPDVFAIADRLTKEVLRKALPAGRLDVVGDFGRIIPILCAGELFGVQGPDYVSATAVAAEFGRTDMTDVPDDWLLTLPAVEDYQKPILSMQAWTRLAFLQIFVNAVNATEIAEAAERAAREFVRQIDALVTQARTVHEANRRAAPTNLLEALVRVPLKPHDLPDPGRHVRLLLAEFAAGSVETMNAALANIFDFLLCNKETVRAALGDALLAKPGTPFEALMAKLVANPAGYRTIINALIFEMLRFQPMGPIAFRDCEAKTRIGNTWIRRGVHLILVPAAAMMDPDVFANPTEFRLDRDPTLYLHFGSGLHSCQGERAGYEIAMPILRALFLNLAALPELRRAAGEAGKLASTFPSLADSLVIRFSSS